MAKTRSQNKTSPEPHRSLDQPKFKPGLKKSNKTKTSVKTKSLKVVLDRLTPEMIKSIIRSTSENNLVKNESGDSIYDDKRTNEVDCAKKSRENIIPKKDINSNTIVEYGFRERAVKSIAKTNEIKKTNTSLSITTLFNLCKKQTTTNAIESQIVLAKMKSYSPWPAKIMSVDKKKAKVFFFGTNNHGTVNLSDCVPAEYCGAVISRLVCSNQAHYLKAVREMEIIVGLANSNALLDIEHRE